MSKILDTVLLLALPASGKSEVRKYMDSLSPEQCQNEMRMGPTLQLDDYPYVHFMHRIDDELFARGCPYVFYQGPQRPFINTFEWGTLIGMLNEDYDDLIHQREIKYCHASQLLMNRLDTARAKVGLPRALGEIPYRIRLEIGKTLEEECVEQLKEKNAVSGQDRKGKTIVIEMARGGPNGAAFPLTPPLGYQYALANLSENILDNASILYVWVDPKESRRKNYERARPDGQSSILHHSVPLEVMLADYGCDDIDWMISQSPKENTIHTERIVEAKNNAGERVYKTKSWSLPIAKFDNRKDLTSFIRNDSAAWDKKDIDAIHNGLSKAMEQLAAAL